MNQAPRSRTMRVLIVLFVAALIGLAALAFSLAWELVLVLVVVMAVMWSFGALSDVLPLSSATRARLAKRRALAQRYRVYRFRGLFWLGVGIGLGKLWSVHASGGHYAWSDFWPALAFMLLGLIAMLAWRCKYAQLAAQA